MSVSNQASHYASNAHKSIVLAILSKQPQYLEENVEYN